MDWWMDERAVQAQAHRGDAAGAGDHVVNGRTVRGVRLSVENLPRVSEWVDGKEFFDPKSKGADPRLVRGNLEITGYSVFTPAGKVKAEFGDLIYEERGRFFVHCARPVENVAVRL
ncbi:hypothetical protein [Micromonospora sp. NPDC005652]|uniref:hypothetical protein n=1 Tax=Micromonospora sp. NPDC005652 TaxID=3157046 RepID=UPI0033EB2822